MIFARFAVAFFAVVLLAACPQSKLSQTDSVCLSMLANVQCTNNALKAVGGHFNAVCSPKVVNESCTPLDMHILERRMQCLQQTGYCDLTRAFKDAASEIKSRVSVEKYAKATAALRTCSNEPISAGCEASFREDVYNPFDLPSNKNSLSYGLIRSSDAHSVVHVGGKQGQEICDAMQTNQDLRCANEMLATIGGHFFLTCDPVQVNKSCDAREQEIIAESFACLKAHKFCEKSNAYMGLSNSTIAASESAYADATIILEKCSADRLSPVCELSFKQDIFNPLNIPLQNPKK
jgi:hypothetical protein